MLGMKGVILGLSAIFWQPLQRRPLLRVMAQKANLASEFPEGAATGLNV